MASEEVQKMVAQLQIYQQQMQGVLMQKESFRMQLAEINAALKELQNTKETELYKISGPILIKSTKKELEKELNEKNETISMRIKSLEKNENLMRTKITEIRNKFSKIEKP